MATKENGKKAPQLSLKEKRALKREKAQGAQEGIARIRKG